MLLLYVFSPGFGGLGAGGTGTGGGLGTGTGYTPGGQQISYVCISVALACISAKYLPLYMLDLCDPNTIGILYMPHKALEMAEI